MATAPTTPKDILWTDTAEARALLARIRPDDLSVAYRFSAGLSPDRFVLTGAAVTRLRNLITTHVEQLMGCTRREAEAQDETGDRLMDWMRVWLAQPEPEDVLAQRFGDPNAMGFRRELGASVSDGRWTQVWRAQFPQRARAA